MPKLGEAAANVIKLRKVQKRTSLEGSAGRRRVMLVGTTNDGKTVTACTISEKAPKVGDLPAKKLHVLDDTVLMLFDDGGDDSLLSMGIEIPHTYDFSKVSPLCLREELGSFFSDDLGPLIESGEVKNLIVSSLSVFDKMLLARLMDDPMMKGVDNNVFYRTLLSEHTWFYTKCKSLPINVVFECHGKAVIVMQSKTNQDLNRINEAKLDVAGIEVGDIKLDITGQAMGYYMNTSPLILPVVKEGSGTKARVTLRPNGYRNWPVKCKDFGLPDAMPAHLGHYFEEAAKLTKGTT